MNKIFSIILIAFILFGCSSSTDSKKKTPLEYTWTSDTLSNGFQLSLSSIWGKSPSSIYLAGHSAGAGTSVFHFDGHEWEVVPMHYSNGGPITGAVYILSVFGFNENDVWFAGEESIGTGPANADTAVIIHYDGATYNRIPILDRSEYGKQIWNIWGYSHNDIWFAGSNDDIYHWDGHQITTVELPVDINFKENSKLKHWVTGDKNNGDVYLRLANYNQDFSHLGMQILRKKNGQTWEVLTPIENEADEIWMGSSKKVWASGGPLRYFDGANWNYLSFEYSRGINGPSDEDLMVCMYWGDKVFWLDNMEGKEVVALNHPEIMYETIWYNGEEAFVVGHTNGETVVFHGK